MVAADYSFVPRGRLSLEDVLFDKSDFVGAELFKRAMVKNRSIQKVKRKKKKRIIFATRQKKRKSKIKRHLAPKVKLRRKP